MCAASNLSSIEAIVVEVVTVVMHRPRTLAELHSIVEKSTAARIAL